MGKIPAEPSQDEQSLDYIRQQKAQSDALFFSIGEGAVVTNREGEISRINNVALDLLGYNLDEVKNRWYPEVIVAQDEQGELIPNISRPNIEVFMSGKPVFRKMFYLRKDGSRMAVAVTVSPILMNNEPIGAIEVFRDITREIELENSKNEFISIASHQLRTPATAVKQYIGMLMQGYCGDLEDAQLKMLKTAYESNERQLTIVNDLLKAAKAEADQVKPVKEDVDLVPLIDDVMKEQKAKFDAEKQELTFTHTKKTVWCFVDPSQIRMVFENLLDNAHKYTPAGQKIAVELRTSAKNIIVVIADEGVGIEKKDIPKLYKKFSRINNPLSATAGGSGLGLFWIKKLLLLHNAKISVRSKPNVGTSFKITLPKS